MGFLQPFPAMSAPVKICPLVAELSGAYFTLPVLPVVLRVQNTNKELIVFAFQHDHMKEMLDAQQKGPFFHPLIHPVSPLVHWR